VLHDKISELCDRVRHLEDALAQSQSLHSTEPHPLLREDLLLIKRPLEIEGREISSSENDPSEPINAMESL
jgi:hypothetical protein